MRPATALGRNPIGIPLKRLTEDQRLQATAARKSHTEGRNWLARHLGRQHLAGTTGWVDAGEDAEERPGQDSADQPPNVIASVMAGAAEDAPSPRPQVNGSDSAAKIDVLRYGPRSVVDSSLMGMRR